MVAWGGKKTGSVLPLILAGIILLLFPGKAAAETPNLLPNLEFNGGQDESGSPPGWHWAPRTVPGATPGKIFGCRVQGQPQRFLALVGGQDRNGRVWCRLQDITPHTDYLLEFLAYRPKFGNGVYLEVELFGQRQVINQHFSYGRVQPISVRVNSGTVQGSSRLVIENPHQEVLAFASPMLRPAPAPGRGRLEDSAVRLPTFFPIGIYLAAPADLGKIRAAGFNAVHSGAPDPETIKQMSASACRLGLKYLADSRRYRADISRELGGRPELLGFYLEDEPEGRSVAPDKIKILKDSLKKDHPGVLTTAALLRPQMISTYRDAVDVFLLDPYPVPHRPLTWLADTIEEAARQVSRRRLWAVIQAFGGDAWGARGWPRRPTFAEMRLLSYLAVVHGVSGLFYFSYPEAHADPAAWKDLTKLVGELRQLHVWLALPNEATALRVEMLSSFKAAADGGPPVHLCQKRRGAENLVILANVIDQPVSCFIHGFSPPVPWLTEFFQGRKSVVLNGNIREELGPYEVRVYQYRAAD